MLPSGAVVITPDVQFVVGNETYKVNATMVFSQIIIDSSYIVFNTSGFFVTAPNSITVTLVFIRNNIGGASNGERVLDYYGSTASGKVWFNLSGFPSGANYTIKRGGVTIASSVANASGYIRFSNSVWGSQQRFQIYQQAGAPVDSTPPVVSLVSLASSSPLDTQVGYGWENVTCTVTDNVAVGVVRCNLTNPDSSQSSYVMTKRGGTSTYYTNRSFSASGNYSYFIRATDSSGNAAVSTATKFSLPPNWDINNDGRCTILDLVLVSNHYDQSGGHGWLREDVDNNGMIQVLDIVLVSGHFSEVWWV
jgi:hypothetical protein